MEIQPFDRKDTEELKGMIMALYAEDSEGEPMNDEKIQRTVEHLSTRQDKGQIIIFRDGAKYCGYSLLLFLWSNELGGDIVVVDELYIKPEFRGQGWGKSFFNWLETRYAGANALALETTPANRRARNLYQRLGFSETDNIRMLKKLGLNNLKR